MIALDVATNKLVEWNQKVYRTICIPETLFKDLIENPGVNHDFIKSNYFVQKNKYYDDSLLLTYGNTELYIKPNEDGSIAKIAFLEVRKERVSGYQLSAEEDKVLCVYKLLYSGFKLLEDVYYSPRDEAKMDFIMEGLSFIWNEVRNAEELG